MPSLSLPPRAGWLLATGALLGLAHPPFHLLVPSFVALVPLALWLGTLPDGPEGARTARRGGFLAGLVYLTLVYHWLVVALIIYTPLAVLAFLVPVLLMAIFVSAVAWAVHATRWRLGWPVWLGLPVFWTAMEWFRAHVPQVGFPWMQMGDTLTGYPWLIGAADLVGSRGLSFWLVLANGLLAGAIAAWWEGRSRRGPAGGARPWIVARGPAAALLAVLAVPILYSGVRWHSLEVQPAARVGVIQPNVPQHIKLDRAAATDSAIRATEALVRQELAGETMDLVLLPETAIHTFLEPAPSLGFRGSPHLVAWAGGLAGRLDAPLFFGALGLEDRGGGRYDYFNSGFLVDSDGRMLARADKYYLVPIVERVPFVNPEWFTNLDHFGGFARGEHRPAPVRAGGSSFAPLICYESIYTARTRHHRRAGADFVVNITNDAWFGREDSWWSQSSALWQHPAHLVMRAVETRTGVARSANTGISGLIDPLGRWTARTELFVPAAFVGDVHTTEGTTFYVRAGDLVGLASMLTAAGAALVLWRRRERTPSPGPSLARRTAGSAGSG